MLWSIRPFTWPSRLNARQTDSNRQSDSDRIPAIRPSRDVRPKDIVEVRGWAVLGKKSWVACSSSAGYDAELDNTRLDD